MSLEKPTVVGIIEEELKITLDTLRNTSNDDANFYCVVQNIALLQKLLGRIKSEIN